MSLELNLGNYKGQLYLPSECEFHKSLSIKVRAAKDHGQNRIKVGPLLIRHLLSDHLFEKSHIFDNTVYVFQTSDLL